MKSTMLSSVSAQTPHPMKHHASAIQNSRPFLLSSAGAQT